jgi:hypothetical protein
MQSITVTSRIGNDGVLRVHLPDATNTEVEAILVYQIKANPPTPAPQFYGCIQDNSFLRPPQPPQSDRERLE